MQKRVRRSRVWAKSAASQGAAFIHARSDRRSAWVRDPGHARTRVRTITRRTTLIPGAYAGPALGGGPAPALLVNVELIENEQATTRA